LAEAREGRGDRAPPAAVDSDGVGGGAAGAAEGAAGVGGGAGERRGDTEFENFMPILNTGGQLVGLPAVPVPVHHHQPHRRLEPRGHHPAARHRPLSGCIRRPVWSKSSRWTPTSSTSSTYRNAYREKLYEFRQEQSMRNSPKSTPRRPGRRVYLQREPHVHAHPFAVLPGQLRARPERLGGRHGRDRRRHQGSKHRPHQLEDFKGNVEQHRLIELTDKFDVFLEILKRVGEIDVIIKRQLEVIAQLR
jgi:hypothetical protein